VHPIALAKVMQIARMMKEEFTNGQSLSAIGGVETGNDAAEFILLGADTVQVNSSCDILGNMSEFFYYGHPYVLLAQNWR
jgi:dihydropyrimidine dehydrogenase (NADP+)